MIPSNDILPSTNIRRRRKEEETKPISKVTNLKQLPANSVMCSVVSVIIKLCTRQGNLQTHIRSKHA